LDRAEGDGRGLDRGGHDLAVLGERDAPDDLVGAAGEAGEEVARLGRVARLAEDVAVERHDRVRAEHEPAPRRRRSRRR
jgi:hypothetical protein